MSLRKIVTKNLPLILTIGSAALSLAAVGLAAYEGAKLKEDMDSWDDDTKKSEKVVTVVKRTAPFIVLEAGSIACGVGSYRKQAAKLAAIAAGLAATQADKDQLSRKLDILKHPEKKEEIEKEAKEITGFNPGDRDAYELTWFHDKITGYYFQATLADFWEEVTEFNNILESGDDNIGTFYDMLLGRRYDPAQGHEDYVFGPSRGAKILNPKLTGTMRKDMKLMYEFTYRYNGFDYNDLM